MKGGERQRTAVKGRTAFVSEQEKKEKNRADSTVEKQREQGKNHAAAVLTGCCLRSLL